MENQPYNSKVRVKSKARSSKIICMDGHKTQCWMQWISNTVAEIYHIGSLVSIEIELLQISLY